MKPNTSQLKYFLYARKSSEAEDRQVASIESQIDELTRLAQREHIAIIDILRESRSAKAPGRTIFNHMLERIHAGEADGIICWKIDRLARNPVDGGQINWMLQNNIIKHIQTYERSYLPSDNVLMMSVELGMANQFIRDLSLNTKRGLLTKVKSGWLPTKAPIGYLNNRDLEKDPRYIIKDPLRFHLVRKLWDLLLTNGYSVDKLHHIGSHELLLMKKNGDLLSKSKFREIFINPFYYGYISFKGELFEGKHEPMVSKSEFDKAQLILSNRSKPRAKTHHFAYTGIIRCGECGAMITAEEKTKRQKNGNTHHYTYYRCTKRVDPDCSQKATSLASLEEQITEQLQQIEIPTEFHRWAMEYLRQEHNKEKEDRTAIYNAQKKAYEACVRRLEAITDMRINNEITEDEYKAKKAKLIDEKLKYQELLKDTDHRVDQWVEAAEKIFEFAEKAKTRFEKGTLEAKREVLGILGSNLILKNGKLSIDIHLPLRPILQIAPGVKALHERLEPLPSSSRYDTYKVYYAQNEKWGG